MDLYNTTADRWPCHLPNKNVCATDVLPMGFGHFAFRYRGNGATPCQYIYTTRKAIDCATTLPLAVFIQRNFVADFWSFIVEIVSKDDIFR